jgi:hypothetical protein
MNDDIINEFRQKVILDDPQQPVNNNVTAEGFVMLAKIMSVFYKAWTEEMRKQTRLIETIAKKK